MGSLGRFLLEKGSRYRQCLSAVKALSKHRLSFWVGATGTSGYLMISPCLSWEALFTFGGIYCCSAAAHSFNQIIERHTDALMYRTCHRPLVTKLVTPIQAGVFGVGCAVSGLLMLNNTCGALAGSLSLLNIGLYTLCYTQCKSL
ncbi:bifunctional UbiA prenyltransferase superfamily/UbiA prenyltransferase conserved site/UbiA prenyltransferase family/Protohem IX farnesyltransferase [Babesia duncani]|uniref:Protoheme IX farnesyltransferase, mitochondrial n=1 Tax=Babesia duncani TaxID=323732 RepID=A0AAD9UQS2_9APIC|nr:bifunctional UbiA prenyltransferase superfamily/UbiA prenyltransferase conserved site/UbiA prenyltransferase family/Protohem IX farnesyltransferase [Babesia duncani]